MKEFPSLQYFTFPQELQCCCATCGTFTLCTVKHYPLLLPGLLPLFGYNAFSLFSQDELPYPPFVQHPLCNSLSTFWVLYHCKKQPKSCLTPYFYPSTNQLWAAPSHALDILAMGIRNDTLVNHSLGHFSCRGRS